jgi:hypothetical protein
MEFDPIKDVLASNLVAIQEALILGIRAPVRDSVHGLINYQYFAQVQEREKYWGGTARENEKGNSQQGREHFVGSFYTTGRDAKYVAAAVASSAA